MSAYRLEEVREVLDRRWEDPGDKLSAVRDAIRLDEATIAKAMGEKDAEIERLREALSKIEKWDLPQQVDHATGQLVSYEQWLGSNGAREYIRDIARAALADDVLGDAALGAK